MQLTIDNVSFERNNALLFSQIHCVLQPGEIIQIRGANGSGKSTLLRILAGYIVPEGGVISWCGTPIFQQKDHYQQQICFIGHQNGVKPYLTAYENLALTAALANCKINGPRLYHILADIGLKSVTHTLACHLSAGQLRRLALTRLLISKTSVWILDEPTTALDTEGQQLLAKLLNQHIKNNRMAIVATHHDLIGAPTMKTIHLTGKTCA